MNQDFDKCWNFEGSPWKTESAWFSFLRGAIRKAWNRHPIKIQKLQESRFRIKNPNHASSKRFPEVWGAKCECCGGVFPLSGGKQENGDKLTMQVDHIVAAGTFTKIEDFQLFFQRMFCVTTEDLRMVCSSCNKTLAFADKQKISFEEARSERIAIDLLKQKKDSVWLTERGIIPEKSAPKRRKQIVDYLNKEKYDKDWCCTRQ